MRRKNPRSVVPEFLAALAMALCFSLAQAEPAGVITHLSGTISAQRADGSSKLLSIKSEVMEGDALTTQRDTYARIKFADGGEIVMRPGTELKVTAYQYDEKKPETGNVILGLLRGGLRALTGLIGKHNREAFKLNTPTATIGIRGTHFGALFCNSDCGDIPTVSGATPENGLYVDVHSGTIIVSNPAGNQNFTAGQFGYVPNIQTSPIILPPENGLRVTMPQAISQNASQGTGIGQADQTQCVMQ